MKATIAIAKHLEPCSSIARQCMKQVAAQICDRLYDQILKYIHPQKINKLEYESILKLATSYYQSDLGKQLLRMVGKSQVIQAFKVGVLASTLSIEIYNMEQPNRIKHYVEIISKPVLLLASLEYIWIIYMIECH